MATKQEVEAMKIGAQRRREEARKKEVEMRELMIRQKREREDMIRKIREVK